MADNGKEKQFQLGFLTTVELPDDGGFIGGLLVTNRLGRPLEFQCTAPVRANRTQEILYGPTLVPHILSDLVGKTLVQKAGVKPDIVLTEDECILPLREQIPTPVACITKESLANGTVENGISENGSITLGQQSLRFHEGHSTDRDLIEKKCHLIPRDANLSEPFERVRNALNEAVLGHKK